MTKQERKLVNASFKEIKKLITACDLDPEYKGKLLQLFNKVIRNINSHFSISKITTELSILMDWSKNNYFYNKDIWFWSIITLYLNNNDDYYKDRIVDMLDKCKF